MSTQFDYTRIPDLPASVYVAPLRKPAGLGDDWLEPAQRRYSAEEHVASGTTSTRARSS